MAAFGPAVILRRRSRQGIVDILDSVASQLAESQSVPDGHTAYVRASGAFRVTKQVASELNKAISQAVRDGRLMEDNPLGESGIKPRTYRLPGQPAVRLRQLGPRSFDELPPAELAALLDQVCRAIASEAVTARSSPGTTLASTTPAGV